jgi:hypothetical protein
MFGRKKIAEANYRADSAELRLTMAEMRLAQFDDLMRKLKRHDNFRFTPSGGIVAYNKGEPEMLGTAYCVPDERFRCQLVAA